MAVPSCGLNRIDGIAGEAGRRDYGSIRRPVPGWDGDVVAHKLKIRIVH